MAAEFNGLEVTPDQKGKTKRSVSLEAKESWLGYWMVIPAMAIIAVFALYPIVQTIWLSLHQYKLNMPALSKPFVGLSNYMAMFQDMRFLKSVWNTFYFTFWTVLLEFVLGLLIALLINRTFKGRGLVRAAVLIPWAIPTVVSSMMWKFMYNDQLGVINDILKRLHLIDQYYPWLGETSTAMWAIIFTDVWKTTPFMALLLLAGLQVIPAELYEAAKVDGAGLMQRFWRITMPLLKPAILVALLFRTLDAFRAFDVVYVMTGGGPGNSTETLSLYAQTVLMRYLDFGQGSALGVVTFLFVMLISWFYIKVLGANVDK
jgi:ABC-type sugar transport system permease subunit